MRMPHYWMPSHLRRQSRNVCFLLDTTWMITEWSFQNHFSITDAVLFTVSVTTAKWAISWVWDRLLFSNLKMNIQACCVRRDRFFEAWLVDLMWSWIIMSAENGYICLPCSEVRIVTGLNIQGYSVTLRIVPCTNSELNCRPAPITLLHGWDIYQIDIYGGHHDVCVSIQCQWRDSVHVLWISRLRPKREQPTNQNEMSA